MKLSTLPTPANIPSITRDLTVLFTCMFLKAVSTNTVSSSIPISSRLWKNAPITLNVSQNTNAMIPMNIGIAVYFPVRKLSILRLLMCSLLSSGFTTVSSTNLCMKLYRISAIAAARSNPRSSSNWLMMCSSISFSFSLNLSCSRICSSPSISLVAANLIGMSAA